MKTKKYSNGGKPPFDPKKPLKIDASAKKVVKSQPVTTAAFQNKLKKQLPSGQKWSEQKRNEQTLNQSYPELLAIGAYQAIKGAKVLPTMLSKELVFSPKKAAAAFGADLLLDAAVDYDREKRKKK